MTEPERHVLSERFADPDLVDRIFDFVVELMPELAGKEKVIKQAVRDEFKGDMGYVRARDHDAPDPIASDVLRLFNGRNAAEVARRLGIGRATVYRAIKRAGR